MNEPRAEFSRSVPLTRLGGGPLHQHIAADKAELDALARRFNLLSLARLEADVDLVREPMGTILLSAEFAAEFSQECIVTLEPVSGIASERFQLRYGLPEAEEATPSGEDDPAFEPFDGEMIDIGEAVAQEFSLALPLFPRAADAVIEEDLSQEAEHGPFAALAKFRRDEPQ
jgi:uncharacterized metal-binding protein YceD (DUF177 family)